MEDYMKKILFILVVPLFLFNVQCKKDKKIEREGIINLMTGTVSIIDGTQKNPAKVGDILKNGMKIETGQASFVDIYFDDNAIKILDNSIVEVKDLGVNTQEGSQKTEFYAQKGKVYAKVAKLAKNDSFSITTPTTTAGVRGTEFLVAEENGKGLVACLNGKVVVKNEASPDKGSVDLTDEKEVIVEKDKDMTVKDLSEDNKKLMQDIKKNFQDMKQDIRERFEKKREEIRKAVQDQRERNKESIEKQKELDKKNVENQKERDKENVERLKGTTDTTSTEARDGVNKQKEGSQQTLENVKPNVKKFKSSVK